MIVCSYNIAYLSWNTANTNELLHQGYLESNKIGYWTNLYLIVHFLASPLLELNLLHSNYKILLHKLPLMKKSNDIFGFLDISLHDIGIWTIRYIINEQ
jgi:hypothetical protein